MTETLFDYAQRAHAKEFGGATYDEGRDSDRLKAQLGRVRVVMQRGEWMTLAAVASETGDPEASVSARIRDLRKFHFGNHKIERRYVSRGLWAYRMAKP